MTERVGDRVGLLASTYVLRPRAITTLISESTESGRNGIRTNRTERETERETE